MAAAAGFFSSNVFFFTNFSSPFDPAGGRPGGFFSVLSSVVEVFLLKPPTLPPGFILLTFDFASLSLSIIRCRVAFGLALVTFFSAATLSRLSFDSAGDRVCGPDDSSVPLVSVTAVCGFVLMTDGSKRFGVFRVERVKSSVFCTDASDLSVSSASALAYQNIHHIFKIHLFQPMFLAHLSKWNSRTFQGLSKTIRRL